MEVIFYKALHLAIFILNAEAVFLSLQPTVVEVGSELFLVCSTANNAQGWMSTWYREGNIALVLGPISGRVCNPDWRIVINETRTACFGNQGAFRLIIQDITTEQNNTKWQCDIDGDRSDTKMIMIIEKTTVTFQMVPEVVNIGSKVELICESSKSAWMSAWYKDGIKAASVRRTNDNKCSLEIHNNEVHNLGETSVTCSPDGEQFNLTIHVVRRSLNNSFWDCRINDKIYSTTKLITISSYQDSPRSETTEQTLTSVKQNKKDFQGSETTDQSPTTVTQPKPGEVTCNHIYMPVLIGIFGGGFALLAFLHLYCLIRGRNKKKMMNGERRIEEPQRTGSAAETHDSSPELDNRNMAELQAHLSRPGDGEGGAVVSAPEGHYSTLQADGMDYEHMYGVIAGGGQKKVTTTA